MFKILQARLQQYVNLLIIMGYSGKGENYVRNYRRDVGKLSCQCRLEGLAQDFNSAEGNSVEQSGQKQWGGNFSKLLSMDGSSLSQWTQYWQLLDSEELTSHSAGHTKGRRLASLSAESSYMEVLPQSII